MQTKKQWTPISFQRVWMENVLTVDKEARTENKAIEIKTIQ